MNPYCTEPPQDAVTNHQVWYGAYKPELWEQCWQACDDFFKELQAKGYYELTQATESYSKRLQRWPTIRLILLVRIIKNC